MKKENNKSVQEWLPYENILENGVIKLKNNSPVILERNDSGVIESKKSFQ